MTAQDKLKKLSALFESAGIDDATKEAEMLVAGLLGISKVDLLLKNIPLTAAQAEQLDALAARRASGEPMQYILGYVEFYGLTIHVGPGVLIPRPETELLVEQVIKDRGQKPEDREQGKLDILDLCTGSGCIALALANNFPYAQVYGVDRSDAALKYATKNAAANSINNVRLLSGDLYSPVKGMRFDLIVSNPPYIPKDDIHTLQKEITDHEPVSALDGGIDGLDFYRRILAEAHLYLKTGGMVVLEIGIDQAKDIKQLAEDAGFGNIRFIKDYSGIERIFSANI